MSNNPTESPDFDRFYRAFDGRFDAASGRDRRRAADRTGDANDASGRAERRGQIADLNSRHRDATAAESRRVAAPLRWTGRIAKRLLAEIQRVASTCAAARIYRLLQASIMPRQRHLEPRSLRLARDRLMALRRTSSVDRAAVTDRRHPRLAYFSPLPPQQSGISTYSAELIPHLAMHYDIDVIVENPGDLPPPIGQFCTARDPKWFECRAAEYDRILYQIGNSSFHSYMFPLLERYPGVVVLHDFYLGNILHLLDHHGRDGVWANALLYAHGYSAVVDRFTPGNDIAAAYRYPANLKILECAQGVIVHSEFARELAGRFYRNSVAAHWAVIPSLRELPALPDRDATRRSLGVRSGDFLICSFGMLGTTKLNHRLLQAWLASSLAGDQTCHLVFVGETGNDGYCLEMRKAIAQARAENRIRITGFASRALYESYLRAADAAVQLRTLSRGETSAAVRDCMGFGLPVVVNAHATMAELPNDAVIMLKDDFADAELTDALERLKVAPEERATLGKRARDYTSEHWSPRLVAGLYRDAIERFATAAPPPSDLKALAARARDLPADLDDPAWNAAAGEMANPGAIAPGLRQLLVDVSVVAQDDERTGIQRVVRGQLMALLQNPPAGYRIEPVRLAQDRRRWRYRYARSYTCGLLSLPEDLFEDEPVDVFAGDILLVSDHDAHGVIGAARQGLYSDWRARGVTVNFIVYDILPITMPQHFPAGADTIHAEWLGHAADNADRLICISATVAAETRQWLGHHRPQTLSRLALSSVHLGADIDASAPSTGLPSDAPVLLSAVSSRPTFLMIGTIEPRKGHLQTLAAFDRLWHQGHDLNLIIAGSEGWAGVRHDMRCTIPEIVATIRRHPELGKRLFWPSGISDEYLAKIYAASTCLIAASEDEGFGLPLIEAAWHSIPVLARDIPVFREVGGDFINYFRGDGAADLATAIERWLALYTKGLHAKLDSMPWLTWTESVERLKTILLGTGC